ncbi:MAG: helix-turn-helix transcriptional regulator [Puniceicoccaceae bacterium]
MKNTLKELRTEAGWSQVALGEKLGVSRQTIIALENGKYDPSLKLAFAIARVFDRSIEDVFNDEKEES